MTRGRLLERDIAERRTISQAVDCLGQSTVTLREGVAVWWGGWGIIKNIVQRNEIYVPLPPRSFSPEKFPRFPKRVAVGVWVTDLALGSIAFLIFISENMFFFFYKDPTNYV